MKDFVRLRDSCGCFIVVFCFFLVLKHGGFFPYITSEDGKTQTKILSESTVSLGL